MPSSQSTLHTIRLGQQEHTYTLRRSARSRQLRVTIHPIKGLVVAAPHLYPQLLINRFLVHKQDWILTHLEKQQRRRQDQPVFRFQVGSPITLLGKDYRIAIQDTPEIRPQVIFQEPELIVATPLAHPKNAEKYFHTWLDRFIAQTISGRVRFYAEQHGLRHNKITVKNQQSLWGSCSVHQNLNFSKRLIQLPLEMLDYVVCHELAHLTHMNHSVRFWNQVGEYFPDYRRVRRHLRLYRPNVILE